MTTRSYSLTFDGNVQALSTLLAAGVLDVPVFSIELQADTANANPFYVGDSSVTSSTGVRIPAPVGGIPEAPYRAGDFSKPLLRMGDLYVKGSNGEKAHVLVFA